MHANQPRKYLSPEASGTPLLKERDKARATAAGVTVMPPALVTGPDHASVARVDCLTDRRHKKSSWITEIFDMLRFGPVSWFN